MGGFGRCTLFALALLVGGGCAGEDGKTCEVPTNEISAVALVVDSGWDIRATIDFERGDRRGAGAPLRLCDTDVLTIDGEDPIETDKASSVEYSLSLPADAERSVRFTLVRQALGDRLDLDIELPPAFEILAPMDGDEVVLEQSPVVQWEPPLADGTMRMRVGEPLGGGQCLGWIDPDTGAPMPAPYEEPGGVQVDDDGEHGLTDLRLQGPEPCDLTLVLARVVLGAYPASLTSGGRVEGRAERYVDVRAVPAP